MCDKKYTYQWFSKNIKLDEFIKYLYLTRQKFSSPPTAHLEEGKKKRKKMKIENKWNKNMWNQVLESYRTDEKECRPNRGNFNKEKK